MKKLAYPLGLFFVVLGVAFLLASAIWPRVAARNSSYTRADGDAYSQAAGTYHQLSFQNANKPDKQDEVKAAEQEYDRRRETLDRARNRPAQVAATLKWTGISMAVLGAVLLLYHKNRTP